MANQDPSGFLSGFFGIIAREFESFVTTATGNQPPAGSEHSASSKSSSERSRKRGIKRSKQREKTPSSSSEYESEDYIPQNKAENERRALSKDRRKRVREPEPYISDSRRRVTRSPSLEPQRADAAPELEFQSNRVPMGPPPLPRLKRRVSITMPGSLYPRSPSMDPVPLAKGRDNLHRVRFAPPSHHSPTLHPEFHSEPGPSKSSSFGINGSPTYSPTSSSPVKVAIQRFHVGGNDANSSILLPNTKTGGRLPTYHSPNRSENTGLSSKVQGKQRATDSTTDESELSDDEISEKLRVRGKERELKHAIRLQQANETRRERQQTEEPHDFDKVAAGREQERDKERIRQLEEEIRQLREELARRPAHNSLTSYPPAPPPPPPPPPPSNHAILRLPVVTDDPSVLFTTARASLKHAPTPKEKPINAPHISQRQGQPTVGITPDKMAAFLQEMKSVRLRKTGKSIDSSSSYSSESSRMLSNRGSSFSKPSGTDEIATINEDVSFLSRSLTAPRPPSFTASSQLLRTSEKRKRRETIDIEVPRDPHSKRQLMPPVQLTTQPQTSSSGSSISPNPLFSEPSSSSTEIIPSDHSQPAPSWTSQQDPEAPTPSLCSDNDPEREDEQDQPPSTPPLMLPSRNMFRFRGTGIPVTPHGHSRNSAGNKSHSMAQEKENSLGGYQDSFVPIHPITPEDPGDATLEPTVFKNRLPVSPLPTKSPRKPHPPARRHSTPYPKRNLLSTNENEQEDPPILNFSSPNAISTPGPITVVPSRPQTEPSDIFSEPAAPHSRMKPSRIPVPSSRTGAALRKHPSVPNFRNRRLNLEEEIQMAQRSDEVEDGDAHEMECGVYIGIGTGNKKRGFLAHGGAGGIPVFMGVGYAEGAEEGQRSLEDCQDPVCEQ